jgi:hypothetical protein
VHGRAIQAAFSQAFVGDVHTSHGFKVTPTLTRATVKSGMHVDASPSWTWRRTTSHSGLRFDIPLTPDSLRLHAWRDLRGTNRTPVRFGSGVSVDPFDQSIHAGINLEF